MKRLKYLFKKYKYNRKRKTLAGFLILLCLFLTLGFATISTALNINGVTNIASSSWDIHFENINENQDSVEATTNPTISNDTTITFAATLDNPGDFYEFTVDIVNDGTYDAMIDSLTLTPTLTSTQQEYFSYEVKYSDGTSIQTKDALDAGTTENIKVRLEYKTNPDSSKYPEEDTDFTVEVTITYVQADSTANPVSHSRIVYTANRWNQNATGENNVFLNQPMPSYITEYQSASEALSAMETISGAYRPFYLKHRVTDNIVTESYIEFIVSPEIAQDNPGMTAGTFALRGGGATYNDQLGEYNYDSIYFETNKELIEQVFGYATNPSACSYSNETSILCSAYPGLSAHAYSNGRVIVGYDSYGCDIDNNASACNSFS